MNTNIKVFFYTLKDADLLIASLEKENISIPGLCLSKLDPKKTIVGIQHILKKIHVEHSDISFDWSIYKFVDIDIFQNTEYQLQTDIYYCVYIPPTTPLHKAYWTNIEKLSPNQYPILRKLLCLI